MSKICVIGLDGGTFSIIDYLIGQDRLPNFKKLMDNGSRATLNSTIPIITPTAWTTFYTGTNPGRHGVIDFFKRLPGSYKLAPVNATTAKADSIWKQASAHDKRVCVFNVPVTYPALPVNGIMVSGMDAPHLDENAFYPSDFREKLFSAFPDYEIHPEVDIINLIRTHEDPVGESLRRFSNHLQMEIDVVNHLMELEDWDFFMAVIRSTDVFQHYYWSGAEKVMSGDGAAVSPEDRRKADAIFYCYEQLDEALGETWSKWGKDRNLVLMSDHGFGPWEREVCVNKVLAESGLLKIKEKKLSQRAKERLFSFAAKRMPSRLRQTAADRLHKEKGSITVDRLVSDIDWEHTKMYFSLHGLFVNLKGREPMGIVEGESGRQAVLEEAEQVLSRLVDPADGKPVVTGIFRREELFQGPMVEEIPDLAVLMRDNAYQPVTIIRNELSGKGTVRSPFLDRKQLALSGSHRLEGILIMHGPDIGHVDLGEAEMVDVAPTLMNLMGIPPEEEWEGKTLSKAFMGGKAKETVAGPRRVQPTADEDVDFKVYSEDEDEEVRKRLQDLGYL